jgi:hypothetical protein
LRCGYGAFATEGQLVIGQVAPFEQLVHEVLFRDLRDRKAVVRYAGLTGSLLPPVSTQSLQAANLC